MPNTVAQDSDERVVLDTGAENGHKKVALDAEDGGHMGREKAEPSAESAASASGACDVYRRQLQPRTLAHHVVQIDVEQLVDVDPLDELRVGILLGVGGVEPLLVLAEVTALRAQCLGGENDPGVGTVGRNARALGRPPPGLVRLSVIHHPEHTREAEILSVVVR